LPDALVALSAAAAQQDQVSESDSKSSNEPASESQQEPEEVTTPQKPIIWIGPPSSAMRALGDKIGSTLIAQSAEVKIIIISKKWKYHHSPDFSHGCPFEHVIHFSFSSVNFVSLDPGALRALVGFRHARQVRPRPPRVRPGHLSSRLRDNCRGSHCLV
jgi:hypothetical protein